MRVRTRCPVATPASGAGRASRSQADEAACEVGLDVFDVVETHRDADHPLRDAGRRALRLAEPAVRGARRMGDRGLGVAEVGRDRADLRSLSMTGKAFFRAMPRSPASALTMNDTTAPPRPDCCAIASACCGCDASPGKKTRSTFGCVFEPARQLERARALRLHADRERLEALQHDPGIERRQASCRRCASPA